MKYTPLQLALMEALEKEPMGVKDIVSKLNVSETYVRGQIKLMEETGRIEKVDLRYPYIYRVPPNSPVIKHREQLASAKADLISKDESKNAFAKVIKAYPKKDWPKAAESLEVLIEAIRQLDSEGKLIDTL